MERRALNEPPVKAKVIKIESKWDTPEFKHEPYGLPDVTVTLLAPRSLIIDMPVLFLSPMAIPTDDGTIETVLTPSGNTSAVQSYKREQPNRIVIRTLNSTYAIEVDSEEDADRLLPKQEVH